MTTEVKIPMESPHTELIHERSSSMDSEGPPSGLKLGGAFKLAVLGAVVLIITGVALLVAGLLQTFPSSSSGGQVALINTGRQYILCGNEKDMCSIEESCSADGQGNFACCPMSPARTCMDGLHCCPMTHPLCDTETQACKALNTSSSTSVPWSVKTGTQALGGRKVTRVNSPSDLAKAKDADSVFFFPAHVPSSKDEEFTYRPLVEYEAGANDTAKLLGDGQEYTFMVIGDWGMRTGAQKNIATAMQIKGDAHQSHFTISAGDNFYYSGVNSEYDGLWQDVFEKVYNQGSLWNPWYVVLGNHDNYGNPNAQIAYTGLSNRWNMPSSYYSVGYDLPDGEQMHIIYLDTGANGGAVTGAQLDWLWYKLDKYNGDKYLLVVGHHPVFSGGNHGATQAMITNALPAFEHYQISCYISGHDHGMQHLKLNNVNYFVQGGGGFDADPETSYTKESIWAANVNGFSRFTILDGQMMVKNYDQWGNTLYTAYINPRH